MTATRSYHYKLGHGLVGISVIEMNMGTLSITFHPILWSELRPLLQVKEYAGLCCVNLIHPGTMFKTEELPARL